MQSACCVIIWDSKDEYTTPDVVKPPYITIVPPFLFNTVISAARPVQIIIWYPEFLLYANSSFK